VQAEGEQRFFVCPTGYVERPIPVSEDEVCVRRFDFPAFRTAFAKENGLKPWADDKGLAQKFHSVAKGRRAGKRVAALYALNLDAVDAPSTLRAMKNRLQCDRLVVLAPQADDVKKELADALAAEEICLLRLGDLLSKETLDIDVVEPGEAA